MRRLNGPTARDSLAQPNGLGLNVGESSGPTVRDPGSTESLTWELQNEISRRCGSFLIRYIPGRSP